MTEEVLPYGSLPQSDFESQYQRLLEAAGCKTQIDLAAVLEIRQSSISAAKKRQSIPSAWLLKLFEKKRISLGWLRTGRGGKTIQAAGETASGRYADDFARERYADDFAREQERLGSALLRLKAVDDGSLYAGREFTALAAEYNRLLQWARDTASLTGSMCQKIYELHDLMQQDPLTGIRNRRYLEANLGRIVKTLCRSGSKLGVLMVDVDYFKEYNDIYGHSMGDAALKIVAAALQKVLTRADDFVARYGGEEFIAILPNTGEQGTRLVAERMLASVRACNIPYECGGPLSCVTVSIGATSGKVTPGSCRDDFIRLADDALYQAKNNGRNNSVFWSFE